MKAYDSNFHLAYEKLALSSAREILTLLRQVIEPRCVVDVGCGVGFWLSVCKEMGIEDVTGVDGDDVDRALLRVDREEFFGFDLAKPLTLDRRFDLVVCLEVAEHLAPEQADSFVQSLTRLGPVVLFSAAIPGQGGVHHVNEQWQDYWINRFEAAGYVAIDYVRPKVWENPNVSSIYAQNILLYVERSHLESLPRLKREAEQIVPARAMVHPKVYLGRIAAAKDVTFMRSLGMLPRLLLASVRRRLGSSG